MNRLLLAILLAFMPVSSPAQGVTGSVIVAWDPDPDSSVAGYKVYYGTTSGVYTYTIDVKSGTEATLPDLTEDVPYYCVVTAYNALGVESGYSEELVVVYDSLNPGGSAFRVSRLTRAEEGRSVTFEVSGMVGTSAQVYASSDLQEWTLIGTYSLSSGRITVNDPEAGGEAKRFYKLTIP